MKSYYHSLVSEGCCSRCWLHNRRRCCYNRQQEVGRTRRCSRYRAGRRGFVCCICLSVRNNFTQCKQILRNGLTRTGITVSGSVQG